MLSPFGLCGTCQQPVDILSDTNVEFFGRNIYHSACFRCSVCHGPMKREETNQHNNSLFCRTCFANLQLPCYGCKQPFVAGTQKFICFNQHWHGSCLKCDSCGQSVAATRFIAPHNYELEEELMQEKHCVSCYTQRCLLKCHLCKQVLNGGGMFCELSRNIFHTECFKQFIQHNPFNPIHSTAFAVHFANTDMNSTTSSTEEFEPLSDNDEYVTFQGQQFHISCFVCNRCRESLTNKKVVRVDGTLLCSDCYGGSAVPATE